MRAPARLITLNLGSQTIGLAEFRAAHGGLILMNYRLREVPIPVSETQSTFHPHAQPNAFHRRGARKQSRLFAVGVNR